MALVYRNGRPRLQRSVRRNGRVTTEYRFGGELALAVADLDAQERTATDKQRRKTIRRRKEQEALELELDRLTEDALTLARDALERAGYHQHNRGQWRRRRGSGPPQ